MPSEIEQQADFSRIRYALCWEDADVLLAALNLQPGQTCLSIASAGDNTLALLSLAPERLVAVDFNPAQIACLELRVAAYRVLDYGELLSLLGVVPPLADVNDRPALYQRCRTYLSPQTRQFWDDRPQYIHQGIGRIGKFERYLNFFRRYILPFIHASSTIQQVLAGGCRDDRQTFYDQVWHNWRWQLGFRLFFHPWLLGRLGRDPSFFRYVDPTIGVSTDLMNRVRHILIDLDPSENPYLQWIATGYYQTALPYALRPENVATIRKHLDRLEWHCVAIEDLLPKLEGPTFHACNLSNIFEYMSLANYHQLLQRLTPACHPGARLAYWNLFVERRRPNWLADRLRPVPLSAPSPHAPPLSTLGLADLLHQQDKAFFYSTFVLEEVI